jgi:hypothetical protein
MVLGDSTLESLTPSVNALLDLSNMFFYVCIVWPMPLSTYLLTVFFSGRGGEGIFALLQQINLQFYF